jgi:glycerol-3-phosphate dehydrogenase (NAD(P)+)
VVSGPTFASEVAAELPAAVVVAAKKKAVATKLQLLLHSESFRVYTSDDMLGVQICGAIKNVLAVAAGVSDGLALGANTRSALITRGLVEMRRIATAVGCRQDTLMGLSGMGDLILTATCDLSRNRRLGLALGQGQTIEEAQAAIGQVIESTYNATLLQSYGRQNHLDMPITDQVCAVLSGRVSPHEAVHNLLSRAPRAEFTLD